MARIGGRSTPVAWLVGALCVGVIAGLGYLAIPMLPAVGDYVTFMLRALPG